MKTILSFLLLAVMLAGCATSSSSQKDMTGKIGKMTYDQAVAELGSPASTLDNPNGERMAEWLVQRGTSGINNPAKSGAAASQRFGVRPPVAAPPSPSQYLRMVFGKDGVLTGYNYEYRQTPTTF